MTIERFVESMPGRLIVGLLTGIVSTVTLVKWGEKKTTVLDTLQRAVVAGLLLLGVLLLAVRIAAIVS